MISVILIWLYITIIAYTWGYAFINFFHSEKKYGPYHKESYLLAGFGLLTVYSELFSLFYKVSLLANVVMIIITLLLCYLLRGRLKEEISSFKSESRWTNLVITSLLFVFFAYGTSKGYIHYDTDLYHAQSIRWIEECGVVKGLGNIHTRLAYNSAGFCISALFSMKFLGIQSYHTCAGYLAYILALLCRDMFYKAKRFKPCLSNMARLVAIYYLFNIYDEMVSPASDYFVVLSILSIVILFAEHIENEDRDFYAYGLLSLMGLVVLSFKISGALIVLLVLYPAILLINKKDYVNIIKFIITGILTVVPFFIRNIILSGYLIYPVTGLDLFNFSYKIPKGIAEYDAKEVQVYGRGHIDVTRYDESLLKWLPDWFRGLDTINKLSFVLAVLALFLLIVEVIYILLKRKSDSYPSMFLLGVIGICFVFMIMTSPNIRFGCVFLWLFPMMVWGYGYSIVVGSRNNYILFSIFVILFMAYKLYGFTFEFVEKAGFEYILCQQDYGVYEVEAFDIDGVTIYCPEESDRTGYNYFPSVPTVPEVELIGENIKDGFRYK